MMAENLPSRPNDQVIAAALEYVESRSLNGLDLERDDLHHLLEELALPLESVAELLGCDAGILKRKAQRWRIFDKQPPIAASSSGETDYIRRKGLATRQSAKYAAEITRAQTYIEEHDLSNKKPTKEQYEFLYLTLGLPISVLGRLLKRGARIKFDLDKAEVTTRSNSEQKFHRYKVDFFKTWSPEMAWVLGLFYTDGYIDNKIASLASTDIELLSKVGVLVFNRFEIRDYLQPDGRNRISVLSIHHPQMLLDLRYLGLEERKSLTMQFPSIPGEYVRHFIRGCWDGDGGFTVSGGKLTAHYTCGSLVFIEKLAYELFKAGVCRIHLPRQASAKNRSHHWRAARVSMIKAEKVKYGDGPYPLSIYKRKNANAYDLRLGGRHQLAPLFDFGTCQ